ncbi:hypothetical protein COCOBI_02-0360 [Coccomyxa sp. Obi]|nr:hypothetical protein COCOBI_02-0360 [Coccomyxa sp. Obi]
MNSKNKREKGDKKRCRPAAGRQSSALVADATTSQSEGVATMVHSLVSQVPRIFGNLRLRMVYAIVCSPIVIYNILVATCEARSAAGPVAWLPLLMWHGYCIVVSCTVILFALCWRLHMAQVDANKDKQRHEKLAAGADSNVASIEEESTPAAQFTALHAACEDLVDKSKDISDQITAQTEVVHKLTDVFEEMRRSLDETMQGFEHKTARRKAKMEAIWEELDMLKDDMDDMMRPPHLRRILIREAMYTLGLLVEQYVYEDHSSECVRALTLNQLQCLYDMRQLSTGQARRWEHVVDFLGRCVSMEELLIVDSHLRKACPGPALGYDAQKESTNLRDLKRWARRLYSKEEYTQLHAPLQQMLEVLSEFTNVDRPCLPDCSFASKLQPSLERPSQAATTLLTAAPFRLHH